MTSPPLQEAATSPGNRESGPGNLRGKKFKDHRPKSERPRNSWRVMTRSTTSFAQGDIISDRLRCALMAPNGRIIPIAEEELNLWFKSFYGLAENKRKEAIAVVRNRAFHGMWPGAAVNTVHLQRGDWFIIRSDESVTKITQMHTMPLPALTFELRSSGAVSASFPHRESDPIAATFGDRNSDEGPTETPNN